MDIDDFRRWRAVAKNGLASRDLLSEREEDFLLDIDEKFTKYRAKAFLSDKQATWLDDIELQLRDALGNSYDEDADD